jgi:hypothetical protein
MSRTIQTAGSVRIDGEMPCKGNDHVYAVAGEYDVPADGTPCRCGADKWVRGREHHGDAPLAETHADSAGPHTRRANAQLSISIELLYDILGVMPPEYDVVGAHVDHQKRVLVLDISAIELPTVQSDAPPHEITPVYRQVQGLLGTSARLLSRVDVVTSQQKIERDRRVHDDTLQDRINRSLAAPASSS